jgi:transcriptional regulator with XRE-family HTH domain
MPNKAAVIYNIYGAGQRMLEVILKKNIEITELAHITGLSRTTIYCFLYNGTDISSARLAKLCAAVGVSTDYILGLKREEAV